MPTLTRRSRFQREPTGKTLNLARRDQRLAVLRSIADYGMLTTSFARALHPDYRADGLRFISQREILAKAPQQTQDSKEPLMMRFSMKVKGDEKQQKLNPDALFGIGYPDGFIFYLLEHERSRKTMLDFQKKIERYK